MKRVTIILPAYNEQASMPLVKRCMERVLADNPAYEWEFLLVNDGSSDGTLTMMQRLHEEDPEHWNYIDLSRNYGKEIAMMAGFDYASGDAVIVMDADMQHPVDVIPEMLHWWEEGYDDVYAKRETSSEGWFKRKTSKLYYRLLQKMTRVPIQKDAGDFRLLDRACVDAIRRMREIDRNTKGLYSWIGFNKKEIGYHQLKRECGQTKWKFSSLFNLALNGIMSYTSAPLRLASVMGIVIALIAIIYLVVIVLRTLIFGEPVQGYPTLMVTILFLGAFQLIALGIIGEYLARVYNESKNRPPYFVKSYNGSKPQE